MIKGKIAQNLFDRKRRPEAQDIRAFITKVFILGSTVLLASIALSLQVFQSSEYRLRSENNWLRRISIPAPRGLIRDRNGELLAENIPSYSLYLDLSSIDSDSHRLRRLEDVLPLSESRKKELEKSLSGNSYIPVKVADNLDIAARSFLEGHRDLIPGMLIRPEPMRYYRYGRELSHVIGYVGEKPQTNKGKELPTERWGVVGREGLESIYEDVLHGVAGGYSVEVDARGRESPTFQREIVKPQRGGDIYLTIDLNLQLVADTLFPVDQKGVLLCLDPKDGEILTLVSRPDYNSNAMVTGISTELWQEMIDDPGSPFFNRVSQAGYPPGSTFKLAVALIALEKGLVDLQFQEPIPCRGGIQYGNRWFRCWKSEGHGTLDLYQAIVQSCDAYFYQLGDQIGLDALLEGVKENLGFGKSTGIDLPHEAVGFIPNREWYDSRYGKGGWGKGVVLNLSIGQGEILVTPLQLASFYAMIAMGGRWVRPHLLKGDNRQLRESRENYSSDLIQPLQKALEGAVMDEKGTAHYAGMRAGVEMAGKTGTAQNPHGDDHSIFVGYAPIDDPEILAVAIVEGAGHGSSVAAPLVGRLLRWYLEHRLKRDNSIADREMER